MSTCSDLPVVLVVGASGVVGRAALEHFHALPQWRAIGVSRRAPDLPGVEHVALDLQDAVACERAVAQLHEVTHVVYAALFEKPGLLAGWVEADQMQTNLQMLKNLFVPLQRAAKRLRHVSLLQGTKAYGAHVGAMRVPGKEREGRVAHENFYWLQEDWLKQQRANAHWGLTIWRPPLIIGHAIGAPMNVLAAIGIFGALESWGTESWGTQAGTDQAINRAFGWPGGACGPIDAIDARLLAQAFAWAVSGSEIESTRAAGAPNPAALDQTFNVTNGDVFVPSTLWPQLAKCFGLPAGADVPQQLQHSLPKRSAQWEALRTRFDLQAPGLAKFAGDSLIYADLFFNAGNSVAMPSPLLSTIKLRKAGFAECLDSEDMFVDWLERLQQIRVLPPPRQEL